MNNVIIFVVFLFNHLFHEYNVYCKCILSEIEINELQKQCTQRYRKIIMRVLRRRWELCEKIRKVSCICKISGSVVASNHSSTNCKRSSTLNHWKPLMPDLYRTFYLFYWKLENWNSAEAFLIHTN